MAAFRMRWHGALLSPADSARSRPHLVSTRVAPWLLVALLAACGQDETAAGGAKDTQAVDDADAVAADANAIDVEAEDTTKPSSGPCDDGRACTVGDVWKDGVCVSGPSVCNCEPGVQECPTPGESDVSNLCKGPLQCVAQPPGAKAPFACVSNAAKHKVCDDSLDGVCVKNACSPLTGSCGLVAVELTQQICDLPDGSCRRELLSQSAGAGSPTPCDDGVSCTDNDTCKGGACKGVDKSCACAKDSDCVDDGDLCNGLPYCDKSGDVWSCKVNPSTIVVCDTSTDNPCTKTACVESTGACKKEPKPLGVVCDDGVDCTVGDACDGAGKCASGTWTCCKSDDDCVGADDGDVCNGTYFCNIGSGQCEFNPGSIVKCSKANDTQCRQSICAPKTGTCSLQPVLEGKGCDDGAECTSGEICTKGVCTGGTNTCICNSDADCAAKEDGDACNGTLYCNKANGKCQLNPSTIVTCKTANDTTCAKTVCVKETGACNVSATKFGTPCDADGTLCTANDACDGSGSCVAGTDVCPCQKDSDCEAGEDGDLCNGTLFCDLTGAKPSCKVNPATLVTCPSADDTDCQANLCQAKTGQCQMVSTVKDTQCEDGDPCTGDDRCDGEGACKGGVQLLCGCLVQADCKAFDDGDVCNGSYACVQNACVFDGKSLTCNDGNPCTIDSCKAVTGCLNVPLPDCVTCTNAAGCNDSNVCTADFCTLGQCKWQASPQACEDGDACTAPDVCEGSACKAGNPQTCNDNNPCTDDACDSKKGCAHLANEATCTDNDACTEGDHCVLTQCISGIKVSCNDANDCTADTCDVTKGCVHQSLPVGSLIACYEGPDGTKGVGACQQGKRACEAGGQVGACVGQIVPTPEDACGGGDEDCDGATDEDCSGASQINLACGGGQIDRPGATLFEQITIQVLDPDGAPVPNAKIDWTAPSGGAPKTAQTVTNALGMTSNHFVLGSKDGETNVIRATVHNSKVALDIQAKVDASLSQSILNYVNFCDSTYLKLTGVATIEPGQLRLVTGGDNQNGSAWYTQPLKSGTTFSTRFDISGFTAGYAFVMQATAKGIEQTAGGYADKGTLTLSPAFVAQVSGGQGGGKVGAATLTLALDGAILATVPDFLAVNQNNKPQTIWIDYDPGTTTIAVYVAPVGDAKPQVPAAKVVKDLWFALGATGKPIYAGFTAGNSSAGVNGSKFLDRWTFSVLDSECFAKSLSCDDGNPCTDDSCDQVKGCLNVNKTGGCSDGDACTVPDLCEKGACVPGLKLDCEDGNACTIDSCDKVAACQNLAVTQPCDDGQVCTDGDACKGGVCVAGKAAACDDQVSCTIDSCDDKAGCKHVASDALCDDGKVCSSETCDAVADCKYTYKPSGFTVGCYDGPEGTAGVGNCVTGSMQCDGKGGNSACVGQVLPKAIDDCGNGNEDCDALSNEDCGTPYKLQKVCGSGQSVKPGASPTLPIVVKVVDGSDIALKGITVQWTAPDGGTLGAQSSVSDASGLAKVTFTAGSTGGKNYAVRATIDGTNVFVDTLVNVDASAPDYVFNYPTFCDASALAFTGVAVMEGNSVRVVTGGDNQNGSFWIKKSPTAGKSFQTRYNVSGYSCGFSMVIQSTASGVGVPAGGYCDGGMVNLTPALVFKVTGGKGGGSYSPPDLGIYLDKVNLKYVSGFMGSNQNNLDKTYWVDYDHDNTKLSIYVAAAGAAKPTTPITTVVADIWKNIGSSGKPIYLGFTGANASAGSNGTKYITSWSFSQF